MLNRIISSILLLALGFLGGYLYCRYFVIEPITANMEEGTYLKGYLPPNQYITQDQKFLFENRLTASTSPEDASKYVSIAVINSVESSNLSLGAACQPDKPVLKAYKNDSVLITNLSTTTQELRIANHTLAVMPGSEGVRFQFADLYPKDKVLHGTAVAAYSCSGVRGTAGFFVLLGE